MAIEHGLRTISFVVSGPTLEYERTNMYTSSPLVRRFKAVLISYDARDK